MSDTNVMTNRRIFTDRASGASLLLEGAEWEYRVWGDGEFDELNHHNRNRPGQILKLDKRRNEQGADYFHWESAWVVHQGDKLDPLVAPYIVARKYGRCATLEDAAREAFAYSPEAREMAGLIWYPTENGFLALTPDGREAEIIENQRGIRWYLEFPELSGFAGLLEYSPATRLHGMALSIEDAAQASVDAPGVFRATIRAMLCVAA